VIDVKRIYETTPPEQLEKTVLRAYPDLDSSVSRMLGLKDEMHWPDWCYLPMAGSYAIVTGGADIEIARRYMAHSGKDMYMAMSAVIPWRLYKAIYQFDDDLTRELLNSSGSPMDAPAELIQHMPYPCVFIMHPPGIDDCAGVFCFLEWDYRYPDATELRMHYLFDDGMVVPLFHQWTDKRALLFEKMNADNQKLARILTDLPDTPSRETDRFMQCVENTFDHIQLLLYLCSEEPDISRRSPVPRRRGRSSVHTASYPDKIDVGAYIGSVIRGTQMPRGTDGGTYAPTGASVRPHVRRAHWHLYWTGAGRTVPKIKWVSAVFVKGDSGDANAVIHPVQ
jgi:hypothetical protein